MSEFADEVMMYGGQQRYIRADLVPQWQPIETAPYGIDVLFINKNGKVRIGWLSPATKRVISGHFYPTGVKYYSHWMPIPKVPE